MYVCLAIDLNFHKAFCKLVNTVLKIVLNTAEYKFFSTILINVLN